MPNPFFKTAASSIRQGIAAKQQDVASIRREISDKERQTHQTIQEIKTQIRTIEADMTQPPEKQQDPSTDRAQKTRIVLDKQKEIAIKQRDMMMERDRLLREIKDQETMLQMLEEQAKGLEIAE